MDQAERGQQTDPRMRPQQSDASVVQALLLEPQRGLDDALVEHQQQLQPLLLLLFHYRHGVTQRCQVFFFYWESTRARAPAPQIPTPHISCYMIAVGGAGSLGSPAAVSGNPIIKTARRNITIIPPKR